MKQKSLLVSALVLLLVSALCVAGVSAQGSPNYDLSWFVIASGGGEMNSPTYGMKGTVGQFVAGDAESTNYALRSQGYWFAQEVLFIIYTPIIVRNWG